MRRRPTCAPSRPGSGVKPPRLDRWDIHVHVPEGATPKDGPSAGIAMVTSIVSVLTQTPVRKDIAMTGEVTLRGNVLPIGGLKEKLLAALRGGITTVLIPQDNEKDLTEIPDKREGWADDHPRLACQRGSRGGAGVQAPGHRLGRGGRRGRRGTDEAGRRRRGRDRALTPQGRMKETRRRISRRVSFLRGPWRVGGLGLRAKKRARPAAVSRG